MFHKEGHSLIILFFIVITTDVIMLEMLIDDQSYLKLILQTFSLILFVFIAISLPKNGWLGLLSLLVP